MHFYHKKRRQLMWSLSPLNKASFSILINKDLKKLENSYAYARKSCDLGSHLGCMLSHKIGLDLGIPQKAFNNDYLDKGCPNKAFVTDCPEVLVIQVLLDIGIVWAGSHRAMGGLIDDFVEIVEHEDFRLYEYPDGTLAPLLPLHK